jgi:hypothetical protein
MPLLPVWSFMASSRANFAFLRVEEEEQFFQLDGTFTHPISN